MLGLLHQQNGTEGTELLDDLTFDLTPHGDSQYIWNVVETEVNLLAYKVSCYLTHLKCRKQHSRTE